MRGTIEESLESLAESGVVLTMQRRAILRHLHRHPGHWTAEDIYRALRPRHASLARGTVYKTLEVLTRAGEIVELRLRKDVSHYDTNTDEHHHFVCTRCNEVQDLDITCPICAAGRVEGHRVDRTVATFFGVCRDCLERD